MTPKFSVLPSSQMIPHEEYGPSIRVRQALPRHFIGNRTAGLDVPFTVITTG